MAGMQVMGYFRCKRCNAGQLDFPGGEMPLLLRAHLTIALQNPSPSQEAGVVNHGIFHLFDGLRPESAVDAENHLLDLIEAGEGDIAFLWDRLGNIYERGGRKDLAAVAFEQAVQQDPRQLESLYSLGLILLEVGESLKGAPLLRRAYSCTTTYRRLPPGTLRSMIREAMTRLHRLQISVWPTADEIRLSGDGIQRGYPPSVDLSMDAGLELAIDWILALPVPRGLRGGKIGRNAPCPCGSGRKYKRCCGA